MNVLVTTRLSFFFDRNFHQGKYYGSDYDSDKSIYYAEGHGVDYHENDRTKVKKNIKIK